MRYLLLLLFAGAPLLTGCSTSGTSIPIGPIANYAPTDPTKIEILLEPPTRDHTVVAMVDGTAATDDYFTQARTQAAALAAMKKEAARLGSHAIVLTAKGSRPYGQMVIGNSTATVSGTPNHATGFATTTAYALGWEKITLSGTAIRYKD